MDVNMLNAYLSDWLNVLFFPLTDAELSELHGVLRFALQILPGVNLKNTKHSRQQRFGTRITWNENSGTAMCSLALPLLNSIYP
jgi:hypothetical protein